MNIDVKIQITLRRFIIIAILAGLIGSAILLAATTPHIFAPGTTISSSQMNQNFDVAFQEIAKAIPVGTIVSYGGTSAPDGWLLCDGNSYSRSDYSQLFEIIGTAFGSANTSSFNVPDLRGRFIRGRDGGAGVDPDRTTRTELKLGGNTGDAIGSVQPDELKSHLHPTGGDGCGTTCGMSRYYMNDLSTFTFYTKNAGGPETRPINVYVNYIIKH